MNLEKWNKISHSMDSILFAQNENFSGDGEEFTKVSGAESHFTDTSLEFGKACEEISWSRCTSTPHRSEANGIVERTLRRIKEGASALLLQSGLHEKWWLIPLEVTCKTSCRTRRHFTNGERAQNSFPIGDLMSSDFCQRPVIGCVYFCGRHLERRHFGRGH